MKQLELEDASDEEQHETLSESPGMGEDPMAIYFSTPGRHGLVQQLAHLAQFGDGLAVVEGGAGSGKGFLIQELLQHVQELRAACAFEISQDAGIAEVFDQLAVALGLNLSASFTTGELMAEIRHYIQVLVTEKQRVLMVIDSSHRMDDQTLGAILSLVQGDNVHGFGLTIILFSRAGLVNRLDELQVIDVPVYDFEMPHFSPTETHKFLRFMLGEEKSSSITDEMLQGAWAQSQGNPKLALDLAEAQLNGDGTEYSDAEPLDIGSKRARMFPIGHVVALSVLLAVLIWALLARDLSPDTTEDPGSEPALSIGTQDEPQTATTAETEKPESVEKPMVDELESKKLLAGKQGDASRGGTTVNSGSESPWLATDKNKNLRPAATEPAQNEKNGKLNIEDEAPKVESTGNSSVQRPSLPVKAAELEGQAERAKKVEKQRLKDAKENPQPKQVVDSARPRFKHDEEYLLALPGDTFTLQIVATSKLSSIQEYLKAQSNKEQLMLYQSIRAGKPWYVLVWGTFVSRKNALDAIKNLPENQRSGGPWPRRISDIHREISKVN